MHGERSDVAAWLDRFFAGYYADRPVSATFIGVHAHDDRLPDCSENATGDRRARAARLLAEAERLDLDSASAVERLDVRLARGFLRTELWELDGRHFHRGNPSHYTGEAVFGVLGLFLSDFAPIGERVQAAASRLDAVARLLGQARDNVRAAPAEWTERAIRECHGALAFLADGVPALVAGHGIDSAGFEAAARRAAAAFADFRSHLETVLRASVSDHHACGAEAFDLHLREAHGLDAGAEEIVGYAEAEAAAVSADLDARARDFGCTRPEQVLELARAQRPAADAYYARYQQLWDAARDVAVERDLLSWPDFPIRYVPRPAWVRSAAPHLYFLFYRSPAAFDRPAVHDYLVTPIEPALPDGERRRLLEAHDDCVLKLNHVLHHGGIGHHVQNWHAYRAASRIGRIAAVDTAARIAMPCGATMAEGWACYATDLMREAGFLTPLEAYAERHARLRICARAVVDVRLHQGRWTLEDAARHYERQAGMTGQAALAEAVKNSMFPGSALAYLIGTDAIRRLRRETSARLGARFRLRDFHDRLLSYGSVPVASIVETMRAGGAAAV